MPHSHESYTYTHYVYTHYATLEMLLPIDAIDMLTLILSLFSLHIDTMDVTCCCHAPLRHYKLAALRHLRYALMLRYVCATAITLDTSLAITFSPPLPPRQAITRTLRYTLRATLLRYTYYYYYICHYDYIIADTWPAPLRVCYALWQKRERAHTPR